MKYHVRISLVALGLALGATCVLASDESTDTPAPGSLVLRVDDWIEKPSGDSVTASDASSDEPSGRGAPSRAASRPSHRDDRESDDRASPPDRAPAADESADPDEIDVRPVHASRSAAEAEIDQVMDLLLTGSNARAYKIADHAVRTYRTAAAHRARGACALQLKRYRTAIEDYRDAFRMQPLYTDLQFIADAQISCGDLAGAVGTCQELKAFRYASETDRLSGMRCIERISTAAVSYLRKDGSDQDE